MCWQHDRAMMLRMEVWGRGEGVGEPRRKGVYITYTHKQTHVDPGRGRLSPSFSFIHLVSLSSAIIAVILVLLCYKMEPSRPFDTKD